MFIAYLVIAHEGQLVERVLYRGYTVTIRAALTQRASCAQLLARITQQLLLTLQLSQMFTIQLLLLLLAQAGPVAGQLVALLEWAQAVAYLGELLGSVTVGAGIFLLALFGGRVGRAGGHRVHSGRLAHSLKILEIFF